MQHHFLYESIFIHSPVEWQGLLPMQLYVWDKFKVPILKLVEHRWQINWQEFLFNLVDGGADKMWLSFHYLREMSKTSLIVVDNYR